MMATLLLRCAGPMQSWGTRSRFSYRDTEAEPTKSGVVGLLAAALGRERSAYLGDLAEMYMAVRVDAPGHLETDYQTALEVARADGSAPGTVLSWRHYLADADFLVALTGDCELLRDAHRALRAPLWPLFLGRKAHVPGKPIYLPHGFVEGGSTIDILRSVDWPQAGDVPASSCVAVIECQPGEAGDLRLDVPECFEIDRRRYAERRVRRVVLTQAQVGV